MRIGIIALLQESNTFVAQPTTLDQFRRELLVTGPDVRTRLEAAHHEVGGFFEAVDRSDMRAVGIFAARALPAGVITADAFGFLVDGLMDQVAAAGPMDGYLVAAHGATVAADHLDADGYWLSRLRERVGPGTPIIGTLDPHANLSDAMVGATTALTAYRTNPHVDQRSRGIEAANLMIRTLRGEIRPTQAAAMPPLAINIERQCTEEFPTSLLVAHAEQIRSRPGVLSASVLFGFPYADVAEMGSAALCVTDGNPAAARMHADEMANLMWAHRQDFVGLFTTVDAAIEQAVQSKERVCLLDMGDNVGGGSPADGTVIASALYSAGAGPSFVCLRDPIAVCQATAAGIGAAVEMSVGARTDADHGTPLRIEGTVRSLHEGKFEETQPRHGGLTQYDMGVTAVIETQRGLTLQLTTHRVAPWSLRQLTSCGLDPRAFHILVAKGVNAPLAAYREVCPQVIRVNSPGCTVADMRQLSYQHRRRPLFPLEADTTYQAQR